MAKLCRPVNHRNIVKYYGCIVEPQLCVVLELALRGALFGLLRKVTARTVHAECVQDAVVCCVLRRARLCLHPAPWASPGGGQTAASARCFPRVHTRVCACGVTQCA